MMKSTIKYSLVFVCFFGLAACGGGSSGGSGDSGTTGGPSESCDGLSCDDPPVPFSFSEVSLEQGVAPGYLKINWSSNVDEANERTPEYFAVLGLHAELLEDAEVLVDQIPVSESSVEFRVPVHLLKPNAARFTGYYVEALPLDTAGATTEDLGLLQADQITSESLTAYLKSNLIADSSQYGLHSAISGEGNLIAVAAPYYPHEDRNGYVSVLVRGESGQWTERNLISPPNNSGYFGVGGVHLSANGQRLVVVSFTDGGARLIDIFQYTEDEWQHVHRLAPEDSFHGDILGRAGVALSGDGSTLAETRMVSNQPVVILYALDDDGMPTELQRLNSQYYHADNNPTGFGNALAFSNDGSIIVIGAPSDTVKPSEAALGNKPASVATSADYYGAVHVYRRSGSNWEQTAVLKERWEPNYALEFGGSVAVSGDGSVVVVGARLEGGAGSGVEGLPPEESRLEGAGAVYIFNSSSENPWVEIQDFVTDWTAYLKPHVSRKMVHFGLALDISDDGSVLAVGSPYESGGATGVWGNPSDISNNESGAAHIFIYSNNSWKLGNYIKASNTDSADGFGWSLALSADGRTLITGAPGESSAVAEDQTNNSAPLSGAIYAY